MNEQELKDCLKQKIENVSDLSTLWIVYDFLTGLLRPTNCDKPK